MHNIYNSNKGAVFFKIKSVIFFFNIHLMQSVVHNQPQDPQIQITIHRVATM